MLYYVVLATFFTAIKSISFPSLLLPFLQHRSMTPAVKSVQLNLEDLSHLCGNKVSCRIICDN